MFMLDEMPNLYSIDTQFVMQTTHSDGNEWDTIPEDVLQTANIPAVPQAKCSFSQLLNPHGLDVD